MHEKSSIGGKRDPYGNRESWDSDFKERGQNRINPLVHRRYCINNPPCCSIRLRSNVTTGEPVK